MTFTSLVLLATEPPDHYKHQSPTILLPYSVNRPDSKSILCTIEELHSFPQHEYVTSLINSAHAHFDLKTQPLSLFSPEAALSTPDSLGARARVRQLVAPMHVSKMSSMPYEAGSASPPDLTTSKSSRASSIVSSNLSDIAGPTDISHFEDIGLDDTHHGSSSVLHNGGMSNEMLYPGISGLSSGAQRRLLDKRPSMTSLNSRSGSFRDLTNSAKRPAYPNLQSQVNGAMREPSLGPPGRVRRGFTTSSTSLPIHAVHRSRSPSPAGQVQPFRSSSRGSTSSRQSSSSTVGASPSLSFSRRTSWQSTRRKSAQELEAEYDEKENDDNDIPDDAYVVNIPISPRMPYDRTPSPNPSRSGSPSRTALSPYLSQRASAPASFPDSKTYKHTSLSAKTPPMESLDEVPQPSRTTSYSSVLSALDDDARVMTAALEEHATEKEAQRELEIQQGARPISVEKRGSSSKIQLPPIQKPSMMMDPLPMSKEKEAVLSRTRPSHLPPKSKEEEAKHLREYKKIMAAAQEAEKKRMSKLKADLENKDIEEASKVGIWKHLIIPNWKDFREDRRVRELWWKGIPPAARGRVWATGIGNELELTHDSYYRALKKSTEQFRLNKGEDIDQPVIKRLNRLIEDIYPTEKLFQHGMPCNQPLRDVLMAYSMYRPDVSLFPGMAVSLFLTIPSKY
ncbi:hypothetical protein EJ05DRAFT_56975 [Pseudovirgaria hyperparasitica]|uniref:Rab-GAP TBC domain-containing protein n=1 Tax=Pseudovirgaria hyperparasitica TaxID=470096 RepID=A0A6A6W2J3_9PEZI|nr:uncharacterized protein EJ05DRAFT_56975 [Pseudovirgaria hyperparasitica]KAF2757148.1 hypothetical protein EJ05DRAFT_56975 [Pseudovirgaria hyperparasitica]